MNSHKLLKLVAASLVIVALAVALGVDLLRIKGEPRRLKITVRKNGAYWSSVSMSIVEKSALSAQCEAELSCGDKAFASIRRELSHVQFEQLCREAGQIGPRASSEPNTLTVDLSVDGFPDGVWPSDTKEIRKVSEVIVRDLILESGFK